MWSALKNLYKKINIPLMSRPIIIFFELIVLLRRNFFSLKYLLSGSFCYRTSNFIWSCLQFLTLIWDRITLVWCLTFVFYCAFRTLWIFIFVCFSYYVRILSESLKFYALTLTFMLYDFVHPTSILVRLSF